MVVQFHKLLTSIMIDTLKGKTIKEAKEVIATFIGKIKKRNYR